jgi:hypothetical protein
MEDICDVKNKVFVGKVRHFACSGMTNLAHVELDLETKTYMVSFDIEFVDHDSFRVKCFIPIIDGDTDISLNFLEALEPKSFVTVYGWSCSIEDSSVVAKKIVGADKVIFDYDKVYDVKNIF